MNAIGIIFANLHERNIPELTRSRTVGSVPFGCRYRLIDFTLSNMVNSGITDIRVVTQYNYQSLMDHIGSGKDWDLARRSGGIKILPPNMRASQNYQVGGHSRLESLMGIAASLNTSRKIMSLWQTVTASATSISKTCSVITLQTMPTSR